LGKTFLWISEKTGLQSYTAWSRNIVEDMISGLSIYLAEKGFEKLEGRAQLINVIL